MEFPVTIDDQAAFDALVKDRLAREKTKLDEAITRAESAEANLASVTQERDDAVNRAGEAEAKVQSFETKEQVNTWRSEVAKAKGVPADALRGSTKEEFEAHADILKPLITPRGPVLPDVDKTPENNSKRSSWASVLDAIDDQQTQPKE